MTETLSQILMAVSFLVNLATVGSLWWAAHSPTTARPFWRTLAAGWTLNLLGNLAWVVYDLTSGKSLPPLSWVDGFYIGRYVLIGLALWQYPVAWPGRRGIVLAAVVSVMALVMWVSYFEPVWAVTERSVAQLVGVALYPILDTGLVFCGWARRRETEGRVRRTMLLLSLAMTAYGMANLINFWVRMDSPAGNSPWATAFWLSCDVITMAAVVSYAKNRHRAQEMQGC